MDKQLAAEWADALESGEYSQGRRKLNRDGAYCAIGVLADIALDGDWEETPVGSYRVVDKNGKLLTSTDSLTAESRNKLGLTFEEHSQVTSRNDAGWSFFTMARWIRKRFGVAKKT